MVFDHSCYNAFCEFRMKIDESFDAESIFGNIYGFSSLKILQKEEFAFHTKQVFPARYFRLWKFYEKEI